jgi:steroid delta-isomerase-like uncharacterized protein
MVAQMSVRIDDTITTSWHTGPRRQRPAVLDDIPTILQPELGCPLFPFENRLKVFAALRASKAPALWPRPQEGETPMSIEVNKAIIRRWMQAWVSRDRATVDELFAMDYTVNGAPIGPEGVKQAIQFLHSVFADLSAEPEEIVAEEDAVAIRWTLRGRQVGDFMGLPPTDKPVELTGINIYQIRDGKIAANHEQTNIAELVQRLKAER